MKIEYALLADAAQAVGGKIFVLGGGWNLFRSPSYPAPVQLAIAIGLGFSSTEVGIKYPLNVVIADEAGVPVVPEMKGQVETGQTAPDVPKTASVKIPVAININLSLPHPGYVRNSCDGRFLDGAAIVRGDLRRAEGRVHTRGSRARARQLRHSR